MDISTMQTAFRKHVQRITDKIQSIETVLQPTNNFYFAITLGYFKNLNTAIQTYDISDWMKILDSINTIHEQVIDNEDIIWGYYPSVGILSNILKESFSISHALYDIQEVQERYIRLNAILLTLSSKLTTSLTQGLFDFIGPQAKDIMKDIADQLSSPSIPMQAPPGKAIWNALERLTTMIEKKGNFISKI